MTKLPLKVNGRDSSGKPHQVLCDTEQRAAEAAVEFRIMYREVWVEDAEGRKVEGIA